MTPPPASEATVGVDETDETAECHKRARLAILELANMISAPMAVNAIVQLNVADAIWSSGSNTPFSASQILSLIFPNSPSSYVKAWPMVRTAVEDSTTEPFVRAHGEKAYTYCGKIERMNEPMQRAMAGVSVPPMRVVLGDGHDGFVGGDGGGGVKVERLVDVGERD
ncbi:hypothetical protein Ancab_014466 [Ancistrocladus abbreviatus]